MTLAENFSNNCVPSRRDDTTTSQSLSTGEHHEAQNEIMANYRNVLMSLTSTLEWQDAFLELQDAFMTQLMSRDSTVVYFIGEGHTDILRYNMKRTKALIHDLEVRNRDLIKIKSEQLHGQETQASDEETKQQIPGAYSTPTNQGSFFTCSPESVSKAIGESLMRVGYDVNISDIRVKLVKTMPNPNGAGVWPDKFDNLILKLRCRNGSSLRALIKVDK